MRNLLAVLVALLLASVLFAGVVTYPIEEIGNGAAFPPNNPSVLSVTHGVAEPDFNLTGLHAAVKVTDPSLSYDPLSNDNPWAVAVEGHAEGSGYHFRAAEGVSVATRITGPAPAADSMRGVFTNNHWEPDDSTGLIDFIGSSDHWVTIGNGRAKEFFGFKVLVGSKLPTAGELDFASGFWYRNDIETMLNYGSIVYSAPLLPGGRNYGFVQIGEDATNVLRGDLHADRNVYIRDRAGNLVNLLDHIDAVAAGTKHAVVVQDTRQIDADLDRLWDIKESPRAVKRQRRLE